MGGWIVLSAKYTVNQCFCANGNILCCYCSLLPQDGAILYSPFLFTIASLQIMPGCKLQLPQAETTWLENGKAFTLTVIVTNVFMDIGVCFYTLLHSQLTPRIP